MNENLVRIILKPFPIIFSTKNLYSENPINAVFGFYDFFSLVRPNLRATDSTAEAMRRDGFSNLGISLRLSKVHMCKVAQKNRKEIAKMVSKFSSKSQKILKIVFWIFWVEKMAKTKILVIFLIGIDLEWSKTYFEMEIMISKKNPAMNFLWEHNLFYKKWGS